MTTATARQHKGIPAGGQFAATARTESGIALRQEAPVILPGSSVAYGEIVAEHIHADGSESTLHAMTTSPEFDSQLRAYLGVEDPEALVTMTIESVYYEVDEGQVYTATCGGQEITFEVLSSFLDKMGAAVAANANAQGRPVRVHRLFLTAGEHAAGGAPIREVEPENKAESASLLNNRAGLPDGEVLHLELHHETTPDHGRDGYVEVAGPADGRPLIVHTGSTNHHFRVAAGTAVIRADSSAGNHLVIGSGARATIVSSPDAHVRVHVEDSGHALFRCEAETDRFLAFTEGTGTVEVQYGTSGPLPYNRRT
ncbi:hypothetical protein [Paenarthrobacter sp. YJN-5]|uniref:hypothetical protein n=1 Tax=unclassified Paenarthrobacter TaxID=2634190 RepID=UPI0018789A1E|nr:hypothetical protein [Paenarthrobacter sp. YJN-5]QOT19527.1 hypothetical protein HMI59_23125 [Paenarthrobacter sp. YJN-5]